MKHILLPIACCLLLIATNAQSVTEKLQKAYSGFEKDSQLSHAISSLYVIDAKTGAVVFDKNSQVGLAGASTQKIVTAATAFELLGKDYRYQTSFYFGPDRNLYLLSKGDPTFGSWRYQATTDTNIFRSVISKLMIRGIKRINDLICYENNELKNIPSGWIFEDIGNYYGAAPMNLNWRENQFDIAFLPGKKEGDIAEIDTSKTLNWKFLINNCKTGKPGSGDNAYVYFIPGERKSVIEGTVPAGVKTFTIAASDHFPAFTFAVSFQDFALKNNFYNGETDLVKFKSPLAAFDSALLKSTPTVIHYSPSLDSIVYWFLKKSINLYGEALVKTFAYEKTRYGSTDTGVAILRKFWKETGLDENELNLYDGSGLSPLNRLTTHAQVEILKYAKTREWFPYFYDALPEFNNMKMKSGTISDVKGYCGYHTSKDGKEYIFSFLVNNYNGRASVLVNKMFKVLDNLK